MNRSEGYEPRFDIDAEYGAQGELWVANFLDHLREGNGQVEVKTKRYIDDTFYVEYQCRGRDGIWRDSGIATTDATIWFFVIDNSGIGLAVDADLLRAAARRLYQLGSKHRVEERDGTNPTKGVLVPLRELLREIRQRKVA